MEELLNITIYRESVEGRTRAFFIVKMEPEESTTSNSIILKLKHFRDLEKESGGFEENLDKINWLIYNAINLNLDSFTIKVNPTDMEQYREFFLKEFPNEYENTFFKFNFIEGPNSNEFTIQINRV